MCDCLDPDPPREGWEGWERWYFGSDDLLPDDGPAPRAHHHAEPATPPVAEPALHT